MQSVQHKQALTRLAVAVRPPWEGAIQEEVKEMGAGCTAGLRVIPNMCPVASASTGMQMRIGSGSMQAHRACSVHALQASRFVCSKPGQQMLLRACWAEACISHIYGLAAASPCRQGPRRLASSYACRTPAEAHLGGGLGCKMPGLSGHLLTMQLLAGTTCTASG